MTTVAVLGLGIMGEGIARNLLRKGFPTVVWNRTAARMEPLVERGVLSAESPAAAAAQAEVVIDVVTDVAASRETWLGPNGALPALAPGGVAVECATLSAAWIRELAGTAAERRLGFVDAPMTGSKAGAEAGTLTLFAGAEPAALEKVRPVLNAFSSRIFHFGPPGAGTSYKLVNNLLLAEQIVSAGEGFTLTRKAGLDPILTLEAMLAGAAASPILKSKLAAIAANEHADTQFALRWMLKDIRYGLELAAELGVRVPVAELARDLYARAEAEGWGDLDYTAVTRLPFA
jgi:3-hydroxyisobutyrate dehydrogenase